MAKQTGLFKFTGKLDNVIGYRRNGTHFVRSMPAKVHQTAPTRQASRNFGIASRKGRLIRKAFAGQLDVRHDGTLVNRLNKALILAGKDNLQAITGFRFNKHTGLEKLLPLQPSITQDGIITIPTQSLPKPGTATHLAIKALAVRLNFAERRIIGTDTATEFVDLNKPFDGTALQMAVPGKGTLIVMLQVRVCNGTTASGDRRYMAADILAVIPPVVIKMKTATKNKMPQVKKLLPHQSPASRKTNTYKDADHTVITRPTTELQRE